MNRREFIKVASLSALASPFLTRQLFAGQSSERPNFLFIITDQQNSTALSSAGNPLLKTPAADSIAAKGMSFAKSYCTNPLCSPSRSSLFTSRMAHETGVNSNPSTYNVPSILPPHMPTMGTIFSAAGYETAYAGKWHLPTVCPGYANKGHFGTIPGFTVLHNAGKEMTPVKGGGKAGNAVLGLTVDNPTVDATIKFLAKPHDKPFLVVCSIVNPHDICYYPLNQEKFNVLIKPNDPLPPSLPNLDAMQNEPSPIQGSRQYHDKSDKLEGWTDEQWKTYRSAYYRLTETADSQIGRVLAALEKSNLAANTIVIFTSDHGEMMGAHKLVFKQHLYEESAAVPLIISVPGTTTKPSVDKEHLVSGLDIIPTMCDYAGIAVPPTLRGKSLRPLVEGKTVPWRDYVISAVDKNHSRMVRTAQYKYIVFGIATNREQLFDMVADPYEMKNLVSDPSKKDVLANHQAILAQWMKETSDPFADENEKAGQTPGPE